MILYIIIPKVKMYSVFVRIVVVGVTLKSCSFVMIVDEPHYYDCDDCDYYDCDCDYDSVWSSHYHIFRQLKMINNIIANYKDRIRCINHNN